MFLIINSNRTRGPALQSVDKHNT